MKHTLLLLLFFMSSFLFAQNKQKKDTINSSLVGPNQVEEQIKKDTAPKESFFDLGFMQPYFEFKKHLKENTGFEFGIDYSSVYLKANASLGADNASSGMVRFYGSWELLNKGSKNSGAFIYKVEHRHKYSSIPPKDFGFEMGYVGLEVPAFNNDGFRLTNFYWRQRILDGKISFVAGLLDATDYVDVYTLASPWTGFMNFAFSTGSETIYIPNDAALGIGVGVHITKNLYAIASISDAGSDPTQPFKSFETFFSNHDYFKSVELGYITSKERFFMDNIHLTYWHSDGSDVTASLPGWGLAFSATHKFNKKWFPFIRGGYAHDGGTLLQKSVTAGLSFDTFKGNLLGIGIGWGEPNETTFSSGLSDQITTELFYRIQVFQHIVFSPDLQFLINPALNPDKSSIFLWGMRARIAL